MATPEIGNDLAAHLRAFTRKDIDGESNHADLARNHPKNKSSNPRGCFRDISKVAKGLDPRSRAISRNMREEGVFHLSLDEEPPAVQLLHARTKLESTVRYLGIEVDDALEMAEQTEV